MQGAFPTEKGTCFRVWAPASKKLNVIHVADEHRLSAYPLMKNQDGFFEGLIPEIKTNDLYRYEIDGEISAPDPASRYQPLGVNGPSQVVDSSLFRWTDANWTGIEIKDLILYEIHTGAFTPSGCFAQIRERLAFLKNVGVTGIELMPVADFPGERNWGYDGVSLYAPARCYGSPDELRALVNDAHGWGLAVLLDVVYSHVGIEGNYLEFFSPYYFSESPSPWGMRFNLDGLQNNRVREFLIDNALYWLNEYHFDGFRFDATHALKDQSQAPFLKEMTSALRTKLPGRKIVLIAEDNRNLADLVRSVHEGGFGLDAVWSDDFHHQMRRILTDESDGLFQDYTNKIEDLGTIIRRGWLYSGQHSAYEGKPRGTDPTQLAPSKFVFSLQNHDQIGNHPRGERIHHLVNWPQYRAALAVHLLSPQTPLLFMGQEWGAASPFLYFTDHGSKLSANIYEGRKKEFKHLFGIEASAFPDPQARSTFLSSKLNWDELDIAEHAKLLKLTRELISLRRNKLLRPVGSQENFNVFTLDDNFLILQYDWVTESLWTIASLKNGGRFNIASCYGNQKMLGSIRYGKWEVLLVTENSLYSTNPKTTTIDVSKIFPVINFDGPTAVVIEAKKI
ncbi:MAG: malto-oligosyltrehalose trehalohydrolase [Elusimicrobia bacterium]|nr:malto-oligosyltrehalose trehalohydrolase [Candidatus Obscuribacterium magneticum]